MSSLDFEHDELDVCASTLAPAPRPVRITTPEDLALVAARLPDLGRFGFHRDAPLPTDRDFIGQVNCAREFIVSTPNPHVTLAGRGAYFLKHRAERRGRTYVSVGALIAAAVLEGLEPVRGAVGPNCKFKGA
ncbi:hypothetical protein [Variovorax sp. GT1P44]|uniref:hypothetical protein n=1 Tax=Variovorax sp. GT1P44 TaxID=3443742 RepID=UPI003F4899B9